MKKYQPDDTRHTRTYVAEVWSFMNDVTTASIPEIKSDAWIGQNDENEERNNRFE